MMDGFDIGHFIQKIAVLAPGFLLAITVHEFMHGYVAFRLGDPTAKNAGRLTLNPISHLDPIGTLFLVIAGLGWAKPVPVDPRYLRNPRRDMIWISLAGPVANVAAAVALAAILQFVVRFVMDLSGGGPSQFAYGPLRMLVTAVYLNVMLAVFNLIPIPPLDGSGILAGLLPHRQAYEYEKLAPYGPIVLMLLFFTQVLGYIIMAPINVITNLLLTGL